MPFLTGLLIIIGVLLGIASAIAVIFAVICYCLRHLPRAPLRPTSCPVCGQTEHEYMVGGLWDGGKDAGGPACGSFAFGICKRCGSRWGQWDDEPSHIPSDAEWEEWVERRSRVRYEDGVYHCRFCDKPLDGIKVFCDCLEGQAFQPSPSWLSGDKKQAERRGH